MKDLTIAFRSVSKEFKTDFWKAKTTALEDVSFEVGKGSVFGLIGPNGAGKTTTIKILMGLIKPTQGDALVLGESTSSVSAKHHVGYLPENAYYYDYLRAEEVIDFYGRLFSLGTAERRKKVEELLELVGLADRRDLRLRQFSKGMLQRIGIAQALVNDPQLVILDEPMSGLDPIGRREVRDIILRLAERGKTILFSSHILSDIEAICDRVAILIRGKLRAYGKIEDLVRSEVKSFDVTFRGRVELDNRPWGDDVSLRQSGDHIVAQVLKRERIAEILDWGRQKKLELLSVAPQKETLEDIFMEKVEGTS